MAVFCFLLLLFAVLLVVHNTQWSCALYQFTAIFYPGLQKRKIKVGRLLYIQSLLYKYTAEDIKSGKSGLAVLYDLGTDCGNYKLFLVGTCSGAGAEKFTP